MDVQFFGDLLVLTVPDSISMLEMLRLRYAWEDGWRPPCYDKALRNREIAAWNE